MKKIEQMKKMNSEQLLENYLYDINLYDNLYITLDLDKIDINGENYKKHTYDVMDIDNTEYSIVIYEVGKSTILTILETKSIEGNITIVNSQFLIKSRKELDNLKIDELTKHVGFQLADLVIEYLE